MESLANNTLQLPLKGCRAVRLLALTRPSAQGSPTYLLFWGFLVTITVEWAPKPYSNYEGPILPSSPKP